MSTLIRGNSSGAGHGDYRPLDRQDELTTAVRGLTPAVRGKPLAATMPRHGIEPGDRNDQLRRAIEGEIIPRLLLVAKSASGEIATGALSLTEPNRSNPPSRSNQPSRSNGRYMNRTIDRREIETFAQLLQNGSMTAINGYVVRLKSRGHTTPELLLQLFAPAARHLGRLWETDACDFAVVTLAMGCLQQAVRTLDAMPDSLLPHREGALRRTILLMPAAGEQHTFPIQILDLFFRRAGWAVISEFCFNREHIVRTMREHAIDVAGLSISRELLLEQLASDIKLLRSCSFNRAIVILVGGRVFEERPELAKQLGADATAPDAAMAVRVAERFCPVCTVQPILD